MNDEIKRVNLNTREAVALSGVSPDGFDAFLGESSTSLDKASFSVESNGLTYSKYASKGWGYPNRAVSWNGNSWSIVLDIYPLTGPPPSGAAYILTDFAASSSINLAGVQTSGEYSITRGIPVFDSTQILYVSTGGGNWTKLFSQGDTLANGNKVDRIGQFSVVGDTIFVFTKAGSYDGPVNHFYRLTLAPSLPPVKITAVRAASSNVPDTTPLAPRAIATVYGTGLNNGVGGVDSTGGATITLCGAQAKLLVNTGTQINFVLPGSIGAGSVCDLAVAVTYPNYPFPIKSESKKVTIAETSPTPFLWQPSGADGKPVEGLIPVATDGATGQVIGPVGVPNVVQAAPGSVVVVWGTGVGNPSNLSDAQLSPPAGVRISPPDVRLMTGETTSIPLSVEWAGESGNSLGLAQFNIRLPNAIGPGTNWFSLGGIWYPLSVAEVASK